MNFTALAPGIAAAPNVSVPVLVPVSDPRNLTAHDNLTIEMGSYLSDQENTHAVIIVRGDSNEGVTEVSLLNRIFSQKKPQLQIVFARDAKFEEVIKTELASDDRFMTLSSFDSPYLPLVASTSKHPIVVCFSRKQAPPTEDEDAVLLPRAHAELYEEEEEENEDILEAVEFNEEEEASEALSSVQVDNSSHSS